MSKHPFDYGIDEYSQQVRRAGHGQNGTDGMVTVSTYRVVILTDYTTVCGYLDSNCEVVDSAIFARAFDDRNDAVEVGAITRNSLNDRYRAGEHFPFLKTV